MSYSASTIIRFYVLDWKKINWFIMAQESQIRTNKRDEQSNFVAWEMPNIPSPLSSPVLG